MIYGGGAKPTDLSARSAGLSTGSLSVRWPAAATRGPDRHPSAERSYVVGRLAGNPEAATMTVPGQEVAVRENRGKYGSVLTALRRTRITPDKFGPVPDPSRAASPWLPGSRPAPRPASAPLH